MERADREVRVRHEILKDAEESVFVAIEILGTGTLLFHQAHADALGELLIDLLQKTIPRGHRVVVLGIDERHAREPHGKGVRRQELLYPVDLVLLKHVLLVVVGVAAVEREAHAVHASEQRSTRGVLGEVEHERRNLAVLLPPDAARPNAQRYAH